MKTTKLTLGDRGKKVEQLHRILELNGFRVAENESKRKFFGPSTKKLIKKLQAKLELPITGVVEAESLKSFEIEKSEEGRKVTIIPPEKAIISPSKFNQDFESGFFNIRGKIKNGHGETIRGLQVKVIQDGISKEKDKGKVLAPSIQTDKKGAYNFRISKNALEKKHLDIVIEVSDQNGKILQKVGIQKFKGKRGEKYHR